MKLEDFHFDLPQELIASYPLAARTASRLLTLDDNGDITHRYFHQLVDLLKPNDLLIFNNTKVIKARLRGHKATGGKVEILIERIKSPTSAIAQIRSSKAIQEHQPIYLAEQVELIVTEHHEKFYTLELKDHEQSIISLLEKFGEIPLPPYMQRLPDAADVSRYQTVYAKYDGSVAAPTAGLHFDEALLAELKTRGIQLGYLTLHIGAGTFAPVRVSEISQHKMHAEYFEITQTLCDQIKQTKANNGRVIAVGTTTLRALESACIDREVKATSGDTDIFITPGYEFSSVDALITNFHLPSSTLMMLVSAFAGHQTMMHAYQIAIKERYRFYSYGDAMFINRLKN